MWTYHPWILWVTVSLRVHVTSSEFWSTPLLSAFCAPKDLDDSEEVENCYVGKSVQLVDRVFCLVEFFVWGRVWSCFSLAWLYFFLCVPWCFRSSGTNDNIGKSDASRCYSHSARKMMNSRRLMLLGTKQKQGEDHRIKSKEQIPFHQRNARFSNTKCGCFQLAWKQQLCDSSAKCSPCRKSSWDPPRIGDEHSSNFEQCSKWQNSAIQLETILVIME